MSRLLAYPKYNFEMCLMKKFTLFQTSYSKTKMIDEKVRSLSEVQPITIGDSVITLVPAPKPQEPPVPSGVRPVASEAVVVPTYQVPPVTTEAPPAMPPPPAIDDNVYPQGLIQVTCFEF